MPKSTLDRFFDKVVITESCWTWTARHTQDGYGQFRFDGRMHRAHRVSYQLFVGPIPEGLVLDHLCRVRNCVNPDHLEPVTNAENSRRGYPGAHWSKKTHCPQGHEYTPENTYVSRKGSRSCRACANARRNRYRPVHEEARHAHPDKGNAYRAPTDRSIA